MRRPLALAVAALLLWSLAPQPASAHHTAFVQNPVGKIILNVTEAPAGPTSPGKATITIDPQTADWRSLLGGNDTVRFFGIRIMGSEDIAMTSFSGGGGCTVSDFSSRNTTDKWQGAPIFQATDADRYMRMIGGFLRPSCGAVRINIEFRATPLVTFYGAFWGASAAPWNGQYTTFPFGTLFPEGTRGWWDLWGTFTDLGYSGICVWTGSGEALCP